MNWKSLTFWSILLFLVVLRVIFNTGYTDLDIGSCLGKTIVGEGTILEAPTRSDNGQSLIISAKEISFEGERCAENIKIKLKTKLFPEFYYADRIRFEGKINKPFNFSSNVGNSERVFDYRNYLAKDDIYFEIKSAKVSMSDSILIQKDTISSKISEFKQGIISILFEIKGSFVKNMKNVLGEPQASLSVGLVVGEKSSLGKDLLDDFRRVGLIHIIVLSGFNITIIADAIRKILSFLPRVWGIVIGTFGIIAFGAMVGGGATVIRSCSMASIALFADLIRRKYNVTRALFFVGMVMIIINPMILFYDPSFQLSFLATLGLIVLANPIKEKLSWITDKFGLRDIVSSTFATQIFVSPYILYMMGQISIVGTLANILVLPFIPITMFFVFLTGVLGYIFPYISQIFAYICHILLSYELFVVNHFAQLPLAAISVPVFSFYYVITFYSIFSLIYLSREKISKIVSARLSFVRSSNHK